MSDLYPISYSLPPPKGRKLPARGQSAQPEMLKLIATMRAAKPGGHFDAPLADFPRIATVPRLASDIASRGRYLPGQFVTQSMDDFVRVWRVA
ncbi:hypothetical protein [Dongia sp.]|uniref:hypothetical protein n=1 Tax=Dongia sp. TaxID=1977262 RepID=UPI0035B0048F